MLQAIGAYLGVGAHPLAAEAVGIGPDAAIVSIVPGMAFARPVADGLAVVGIATAAAQTTSPWSR
jgi:hypothetical protein